MARPDKNAAAETRSGERLARLFTAVQDAPNAAESLRAFLRASVDAFGWRAGVLYAVGRESCWIANPDEDVTAPDAADRRLLTDWAWAVRTLPREEPLRRPGPAASMELGSHATVAIPVEGETAYLLQLLGQDGYTAASDFGESMRRVTAVVGLRIAHDRGRQRFDDLAGWLTGHYWETDENHRFVHLAGMDEVPPSVIRERLLGKTRWEVAGGDIVADPKWRRHVADLEAHRPIESFEFKSDVFGKPCFWRISGRPIFDSRGYFRGYRGVASDVTALFEADRAADRARVLLHQAIDNLPLSFALWDADDRLILCNKSFRHLNTPASATARLGVSFAQHVRGCLAAGLFPEARGREEDWFEARMRRHRNPGPATEIERADGRCLLLSEFRTDDGGTIQIGMDITRRKQAENDLRRARDELEQRVAERTAEIEAANRALRESEERFRDYAAASADWFWELDANLRFSYMSENVERVVGVGPEWHYGKTRADVLDQEKLDANWREHLETLGRHEPFRDFVYRREGDGNVPTRWLLSSGLPRFDAAGRFLGYRGIGREVTETLEAQRRLRESEALLRLITDNLPVMVAYVDSEQRYAFVNKLFERWMARPADALIGRTVRDALGDKAYRHMRPYIEQALAGVPVQYENRIAYPDGTTRDMQMIYMPDADQDRHVRGYVGLAMDVSAERTSEAQLRQAQKMEAVGQLTGGIAHDFNNLLTVVLGSLELLALDIDAASEAGGYLDEARQAVERGSLLVRQLLAFARRQTLSPQPTDVNGLISSFAPILQLTLSERIRVETALEPALWPATVDQGQLENVLLNLALNARDALPEGGTISIATANVIFDDDDVAGLEEVAPGPYVMLSLADAGTGMMSEVLARAMEPFFTTKDVGLGSGLGLSMVFGFVKQSHGHLAIESVPGAGTTVRLYLPRADVAAAPVARAGEAVS